MKFGNIRRCGRYLFIAALVVVAFGIFFGLVRLGHTLSGSDSASYASWVQAIGSIATIAAGFGVASYQLKAANEQQEIRDKEATRARKRSQYLLLSQRVLSIQGWAETTFLRLESSDWSWAAQRDNCEDLIRQFDRIDSASYPSPNVFPGMNALRINLRSCLKAFDDANTPPERALLLEAVKNTAQRVYLVANSVAEDMMLEVSKLSNEFDNREDEIFLARQRSKVNFHKVTPSDTDKPQDPLRPMADS